jgi:hypothetical protein
MVATSGVTTLSKTASSSTAHRRLRPRFSNSRRVGCTWIRKPRRRTVRGIAAFDVHKLTIYSNSRCRKNTGAAFLGFTRWKVYNACHNSQSESSEGDDEDEDDDEEDESDSGSDYIPEYHHYQDYCHVSWVRQGITLATQKGLTPTVIVSRSDDSALFRP